MRKIEIPLSKTKTSLLVIGSILFIAAGFFIIFILADQQSEFDPIFIKGVAIIAILFFGATGIFAMKKLFSNKMGLVIDNEGIYDNSSGMSIGLIRWTDITEIKTEQVSSTNFLLIYTKKPEFYIEQAKGLKKKLMKANHNMYATPISISSNTLKCKFCELEQLLQENLRNYRTPM